MNANLVKTIKVKSGLTIEQYCSDKLNTTYKSFSYRVRHDALKFNEYIQIMKDTSMTFEQLFLKDSPVPRSKFATPGAETGQNPERHALNPETTTAAETTVSPDGPTSDELANLKKIYPHLNDEPAEDNEPDEEFIDTFATQRAKMKNPTMITKK